MDIQAHEQSRLSALRKTLILREELIKRLYREIERLAPLEAENAALRQELTQVQESHAYLQRDYEALRHCCEWLEDATIVFVIQEFAPNGWQDKQFCYGSQVEALAMLDRCGDGRYRLVAYVTVELARKGRAHEHHHAL